MMTMTTTTSTKMTTKTTPIRLSTSERGGDDDGLCMTALLFVVV